MSRARPSLPSEDALRLARPVAFGCAGPRLLEEEARFFAEARPLGFILFARNCESPEQIRALIGDLKAAAGFRDALILIDQEGGRVARLRPPRWRAAPPGRRFGDLDRGDPGKAAEAARLNGRLLAAELRDLGIGVDCAPVLDLAVAGAHDIIGDRAFSEDPETVGRMGRALIEGLTGGGVWPVIKHIPGHGRATLDSHLALPIVETPRATLSETDFVPFRMCNDAAMAMTAHIVYRDIDPDHPATLSRTLIEDAIRGEIGFSGVLLSDDVCMEALGGGHGARAKAAIEAGCDAVLHCNGKLADMRGVAEALEPVAGASLARLEGLLARPLKPEPIDRATVAARLAALLGESAESAA